MIYKQRKLKIDDTIPDSCPSPFSQVIMYTTIGYKKMITDTKSSICQIITPLRNWEIREV